MEGGDNPVKSVARVFSVLEMFDRSRKPLNGTAVARHLNIPQSSAVAVLKSMVLLGYLTFDKIDRCYLPTMRVALLGEWLMDTVAPDGHLLRLIRDIGADTHESVALSAQTDLEMQWLHVQPGTKALTVNLQPGDRLPLLGSLNGMVALSGRTEDEILCYIDRINRKCRIRGIWHNPNDILERTAQIRALGYGIGRGAAAQGTAAIAWLLPPLPGSRRVVLSVAGAEAAIEEAAEHIITTVRGHLNMCFHAS